MSALLSVWGLSMRIELRLLSEHLETDKYKYDNKLAMDKCVVAAVVVRTLLLKRRHRAARRLKQMKEERRRRQAFVKRQAMEQLMFVVLLSVTCCNLSPERVIWMKERSSHWWPGACC